MVCQQNKFIVYKTNCSGISDNFVILEPLYIMKTVGGNFINMKILTYTATSFVPYKQIFPGDRDRYFQRRYPGDRV